MITVDQMIAVLAGAAGTFGFGILFNIRGKKLMIAALGGLLAWLFFVLLGNVVVNETVRYFIVSVLASCYAEVFARVMKTPRTTFWIVCLIPLIPGSSLYYTMSSAVAKNTEAFMDKGLHTLELTTALALGIVTVAAGAKWIFRRKNG